MKKRMMIMLSTFVLLFGSVGCDELLEDELPEEESIEQESESETSESMFANLNSFEASTLDGDTFTEENFADYDLTIVNVWGVTCNPCIQEMPELEELRQSLPKNIQLITLCIDGEDYASEASEILSSTGFEGITIFPGSEDMETFCSQIMYTPTTVMFDSKGNAIGADIIGSPANVEEEYYAHINEALEAMGKEGIK